MTVIARDSFQRVTAGGWGTADVGGSWTNTGGTSEVSTDGAAARFAVPASSGRGEYLGSVSQRDQYVLFRMKFAALPATGGYQIYPLLRRVDANNNYSPTIDIATNGNVGVSINRLLSGVNTQIYTSPLTLHSVVPGEWFWMRCEATGASPTTIRFRIWKDGDVEQSVWSGTVTDSSAALQVASAFGFSIWAPSASPPVVSIDDLLIVDAPATFAMTLGLSGSTIKASPYPPATTPSYVDPPAVALPGYLVPFIDPTWGTKITRVTNVNYRPSTGGTGPRHNYSRSQVWNSDQTRIMLGGRNPGALLDGSTYAIIDSSLVLPTGGVSSYWSNIDPDKMYFTGTNSNVYRSWKPSTEALDPIIRTFTGYYDIRWGSSHATISDDDRYVSLNTRTSAGGGYGGLVYDLVADVITGTIALPFDNTATGVAISPSGQYVIVSYDPGFYTDGTGPQQGIWLYDRAFNPIRQLRTRASGHFDWARDFDGSDCLVHMWNRGEFADGITKIAIPSGAKTDLGLPIYSAFATGHCSGQAINRPGWIYCSTDADKRSQSATLYRIGFDQLLAVKMDGSGIVEVFGHAHQVPPIDFDYDAGPQATPSRDGKKVLFSSAWGTTPGSGDVFVYVAEKA